jgi:hypothetical protein
MHRRAQARRIRFWTLGAAHAAMPKVGRATHLLLTATEDDRVRVHEAPKMSAEERAAILHRMRAASHRSQRLVAVARSLRAAAEDARTRGDRIRRGAFAFRISGGMADDSREQIVRRKMERGLLPLTKAQKTWYSKGQGKTWCVACGLLIDATHIEVEADFDGERTPALKFHSRCFDAWRRLLHAVAQ